MGEISFKNLFLGFLFIIGLFLLVVVMKNSGYTLFNNNFVSTQNNFNNLKDINDNNFNNNLISGFAVHPLYPSFSAANSGFSFNNINGLISASDTVVYKTGFYSVNGGAWQNFTLSGGYYNGDVNWLSGSSSSLIPVFGVGEHYVIVYSCTYNSSDSFWNCHDNKWQLIVINNTAPVNVSQKYLVQNNIGYADIIISPTAPNTVKLAADYFQMYIYNMSGVTLPILNSPGSAQNHVYIGRSSQTDSMGITSSGCKDGGFKMISGTNYLVLLGDDTVTNVPGITNSLGPRDYIEWDAYVSNKWGESFKWGNDFIEAYTSHYNDLANIWEGDERGSLNAVYEFLYNQGIRWYYPGWYEYRGIGTIIPEKSSISFEDINVLINPDASVRSFALYGYNYPGISEYHLGDRAEEVLQWVLSLRTNLFYDYMVGSMAGPAHGMVAVIDRQKSEHPEYFAVYDGVRQIDPPSVNLCFPQYTSQNRLFEETVKYAKTMFDLYDIQVISIMPTDGFEGPSDECKNKETPERGYDGMYSDYVWEFVNNVAWEIYNDPQYADKIIYNSAYGNYGAPPINLSQPLAPNIWVMLPRTDSVERYPNTELNLEQLSDMWMETFASNNYLTGGVETNKLFSYDSYYYNVEYNPERNMPFYMPHLISNSLKMLKGTSVYMGEFMEIPTLSGETNPTYDVFVANSLNTYITARLYWNVNQDINAIMNEYYILFYGPAASKMKELIEYSENNYAKNRFYPLYLSTLKQKANEALAMVPPDSKYAQRIIILRDLLYVD